MSKLSFFKSLIGVKVDQAGDAAIKELMKHDPVAGMKAQMEQQKHTVAKWRSKVVEAERALADDEAETAVAERRMNDLRSKLERVQEFVKSEDVSKRDKEALLNEAKGIADEFKNTKAKYEKELEDDKRKQAILDRVRNAYRKAQLALNTLEQRLQEGKERMEEAQATKAAAEQEEALNRELAGMEDASSNLNLALAAMNDVAAEAEREAREAELRMDEAGISTSGTSGEHASVLDRLERREEAAAEDDPFACLG